MYSLTCLYVHNLSPSLLSYIYIYMKGHPPFKGVQCITSLHGIRRDRLGFPVSPPFCCPNFPAPPPQPGAPPSARSGRPSTCAPPHHQQQPRLLPDLTQSYVQPPYPTQKQKMLLLLNYHFELQTCWLFHQGTCFEKLLKRAASLSLSFPTGF